MECRQRLIGINASDARRAMIAKLPDFWNGEGFMTGTLPHKLGIVRVAIAAAATTFAFYFICWLGAQLPIGPATHMYLRLFIAAELTSTTALVVGLCWSLGFALIAGGLFALFYNLFASLER